MRSFKLPVRLSFGLGLTLALFALLGIALIPVVYAAGIVVNSTSDVIADDGACTLREAIIAANTDTESGVTPGECVAGSGADTITFAVTGSFNLTITGAGESAAATGDLDITDDLTIVGQGADSTIIDATGLDDRVFHILSGTTAISGVTVANGNVTGFAFGGGIENLSNLVLTNTVVSSNTASVHGGGIASQGVGTTMSIYNSQLYNNISNGDGGGIRIEESHVQIINSDIYSNTGNRNGGILNYLGRVVISGSHILTNTGNTSNGGGLWNEDGPMTIINSLIENNGASVSGGGIYNWENGQTTVLTITNSNIINNDADNSYGGGIYNNGGQIFVTGVNEISDNYADSRGGGIYVSNGGTLSQTGSITIANNYADYIGGAIYIHSVGGGIWLNGAKILSNTADYNGGALYFESGTVVVNNSCIVNNSHTSFTRAHIEVSTKDATGNWWGADTGPSGVGPGLGDSVSASVDYSGFLTSAPAGCPATPPPPFNITIRSDEVGSSNIILIGQTFIATGPDAELMIHDLFDALDNGDVTVTTGTGAGEQAGNIIVENNIDFDGLGVTRTLTLSAANNITITSVISDFHPFDPEALHLNLIADYDNSGGGSLFIDDDIHTGGGDFTAVGRGNAINNVGIKLYGNLIDTGVGDISLTGTGAAIGYQDIGVLLSSVVLQTTDGNIILDGAGGDVDDDNYGIYLYNSTIEALGSGAVDLTGVGGNGVDDNYGIYVIESYSTIETASGDITLKGTASGSGSDNRGVVVDFSVITSTLGGSIVISGSGSATATGTQNYGVYVKDASIIETGLDGNISITGTGGTGVDTNIGVYINEPDTRVRTLNGNINFTGTGGINADDSYGIYVYRGAQVESTGLGNITMMGVGGNGNSNNHGIYVNYPDSNISAFNGDINLIANGQGDGTGSQNFGLYLSDGGVVEATGTGNITINGTAGAGISANYGISFYDSGAAIKSASGNINLIGTGNGSDSDNYGFVITGTGGITATNGGNIAVTGIASPGASGSNNYGVYMLDGATIDTTLSGNIAITGTGSNGSGLNRGIFLRDFGTRIQAVSGDINLTGTGNGSGSNNDGIAINEEAKVASSSGGAITVNATASASATGSGNDGLHMKQGGVLQTTLNGSLVVTGTGGSGTNFNYGLYLSGFGTTLLETINGPLSLNGLGGTGTLQANRGIHIEGGTLVSSVSGDITLNGTAGPNAVNYNDGIFIGDSLAVSSVDGDINLIGLSDGSGFSNDGLELQSFGSMETSGNGAINITANGTPGGGDGVSSTFFDITGGGPITMTANSLNFDSASSVSGVSSLHLQPLNPSDAYTVDDSLTDILQDGFTQITIGRDNSSGAISLSGGPWIFNDPLLIQAPVSGGAVDVSANGLTGADDATLTLVAHGNVDTFAIANPGQPIVISSTNGNINTLSQSLDSGSVSGDGGDISLTALNGTISVGEIWADTSAANSDSGTVSLSAGGDITVAGRIDNRSQVNTSVDTGNAGDINLTSANGNIATGVLFPRTLVNALNGTAGNAGKINLEASNGSITVAGGAFSPLIANSEGGSSGGNAGNGGDVSLNAGNNITISGAGVAGTRSSAPADYAGSAGSVQITATNDITITGFIADAVGIGGTGGAINIDGRLVKITAGGISLNTAGDSIGGEITIKHNGNGLIPFIVGDASTNGSAGDLTTGGASINASQSFFTSHTETGPPDINILTSAAVQPGPVFTVNTTADGGGVCLVTDCSLRQAINAANATGGLNTIAFNISGIGPHTIQPLSALPALTDPVIIDGATEPDFAGTPIVEINGALAGPAVSGLNISAGGSTVRGLVINRFDGSGIVLSVNGNNYIQGNYIGTNVAGDTAQPNSEDGVAIKEVANNIIGGANPAERNLLSGNIGRGLRIFGTGASGNQVLGNYIGTDISATLPLGNALEGIGVELNANNNTIGGLNPGEGNIIAFNASGVAVLTSTQTTIRGNSIFSNIGLGIDLGADGRTENDRHDPDVGANLLQNHPKMVRAYGSGPFTTTLDTRLDSITNTLYAIDYYVSDNCATPQGQSYLGSTSVISASTDFRFWHNLPFAVPDGKYVTVTATDPNGNTSEFSECVVVSFPNDSWWSAMFLDLIPDSGDPTVSEAEVGQYLDKPGQSRWYRFPVQPNGKVIISLTDLPENYDITLYKDIAQANQQIASPEDLAQIDAEFAPDVHLPDVHLPDVHLPDVHLPDVYLPDVYLPDVHLPDVYLPDAYAPDVYLPDVYLPDVHLPDVYLPDVHLPDVHLPDVHLPDVHLNAYSGAQLRSIIAASYLDGTADELIVINTWNNTGDFYLRVRGRNGVSNINESYLAKVRVESESCNGVTPLLPPTNTTPQVGTPNPYKTIILFDSSRIEGTAIEIATLQNRLADLAARDEVRGVVIDLSLDAKVSAANAQADGSANCPYAKNLVAEAAKEIIDGYWELNPLEYVVIVGNDETIPFYRHPDKSSLAKEDGFVPPVENDTHSQASLKFGYVLSQDFYGAKKYVSLNSSSLPVPLLGVGRLVETASEATTMLDAYLATSNGILPNPTSTFISGYDFITDAAEAVEDELNKGTAISATTLIAPADVAPGDPGAWDADQFRDGFLGERRDISFLAGHFNASRALAADYETRFLSVELEDSAIDLSNALIYSIGCHAGYNIVNAHNVPNVTEEPDWAQAFARKGAILIAGTGYQYGDTDFIEYSERLYLQFTRELRTGTGPVSIGQAMVRAKQHYLANTMEMRGIHEKSLLEATIFGLPMASYNLPGERIIPSPNGSIVGAVTPYLTNPGANLGLTYADINISPNLMTHTKTLSNANNLTELLTATYFSGPNGVLVNPAEPVLPLEVNDVTPPGSTSLILRGTGFRGSVYQDMLGMLPLASAPATEVGSGHYAFFSDTFFKERFWRTNQFDILANGLGARTRLFLTPVQYRSQTTNSPTGTLRLHNNVDLRLFYSNNTTVFPNTGNVPALSAPPSIVKVASLAQNDVISFTVIVNGDPAAGVQEVWVTYSAISGTLHGQWQSLDLTQDPQNSLHWHGQLALSGTEAEDVRFMVQAVNGVGLVTLLTNQGAYFVPNIDPGSPSAPPDPNAPPPPPPAPTSLIFESAPPSASFDDAVSFSVYLSSNSAPVANALLSIQLGSQRRYVSTASDGRATVNMTLVDLPGLYQAQAVFAGSSAYHSSSAFSPFILSKQGTNLALNPSSAVGQYSDPSPIKLTLTDTKANAVREKKVFLVVSGNGITVAHTEETNLFGQTTLEVSTVPSGIYALNGHFSGLVPQPGGTLELNDPKYAPSVANGSINILAEDAEVTYTGQTLINLGQTLQLSATVVQTDDGWLGDISLAQVQFTVKEGTTVIDSLIAPVDEDGIALAELDNLPGGTYTLETQVVGGYFSSLPVLNGVAVDAETSLSIIKVAQPQNGESFDFSSTLPGYEAFSLIGDGSGFNDRLTVTELASDTYLISETLHGQWVLLGVSCKLAGTQTEATFETISDTTDSLVGVSVNLSAGEDVACTFTNNQSNATTFAGLQAVSQGDGRVILTWSTLAEVDVVGFNVMRAQTANGSFAQVNDRLILAEGDAFNGADYTFSDESAGNGPAYYYLQEELAFGEVINHVGQLAAINRWQVYLPLIQR